MVLIGNHKSGRKTLIITLAMEREYQVRLYRSGDEEQIIQLLQTGFGGWPQFDVSCEPIEHWKWKYLENPLKTKLICVAESENKLVGCYHMFLVNVKIRDNITIWRLIADLAVHPQYRRLGIYRKMWNFAAEKANEMGLNFSYWVSGNPIIISTSEDYPGFPYPILNLVRIQDIDRQLKAMSMVNAWLYKIGFYTSKLTNLFRNILKKHKADWQSLPVYEVNSFTDILEEFWTKVSKHYNFIIVRNRKYLNWRYCDPRAGDFIIRKVEIEGQILGFSVLKINKLKKDYPVGFIVDMITSPNRLDVANRLIVDAVEYFDNQEINIINCQVIKGHPFEMIYRRHGFLDSRMTLYLYFGSPDIERENLEIELNKIKTDSVDRLHFSYGDIDSLPSSLPVRR